VWASPSLIIPQLGCSGSEAKKIVAEILDKIELTEDAEKIEK